MGVAAPALDPAACAQLLSVCDACTQGVAAQRHEGNSTVHAQEAPSRAGCRTIVSLQNHIYTKSGGLQLKTFKLSFCFHCQFWSRRIWTLRLNSCIYEQYTNWGIPQDHCLLSFTSTVNILKLREHFLHFKSYLF